MKWIIILLLAGCTYERDIQVEASVWTLIGKKHAERWHEQNFYFLIWQDERGLVYNEKVKEEEAGRYLIGFKTVNRMVK